VSFFRQWIGFPYGAVVERTWHRQQALAKEIKEDQQRGEADGQLHCAHQAHEAAALREGHPGQLLQARGANDPVIVFRDAFTAEELAAFRAARRGLTGGVVEAALVTEGGHLLGH